jgi:hypothetical protein
MEMNLNCLTFNFSILYQMCVEPKFQQICRIVGRILLTVTVFCAAIAVVNYTAIIPGE